MDYVFIARWDGDFPYDDVVNLGRRLDVSSALVPGFIPPPAGMFDIQAIVYARKVEKLEFHVLPDRNLVSRMAQVARFGAPTKWDKPGRLAVDLMAFCQAANMIIEPSIAFHELAHFSGNDEAHEELAWFRAADRNAAASWIELAMGRRSRIELGQADHAVWRDLAFPLKHWRRNYIVTLKIAELELTPLPHLDKALALIRWMYDDFIVAGPALMLAAAYFAPSGTRKRMVKRLRSLDREAAIRGLRNAAWDITHLSDFVRRIQTAAEDKSRPIFATADEDLARIARLLFADLEGSAGDVQLVKMLGEAWPAKSAERLVKSIRECVGTLNSGERARPKRRGNFIQECINEGETRVRLWRP